ncbi:MAG: glycosyltransferase [Proteobacteria bacterium]|nr:glycosyltransferase [Pseudomonadota bacterium]
MNRDWISEDYQTDLVSVIIPTYNRATFIADTLQSVFDQTYRPVEVIVIDDGSTDNTYEIVHKYETKQSKGLTLRYIHQKNQGAQKARNRGCRECRGEFIQFLDDDDLLMKDKLLNQIRILRKHKAGEVDVVYGDSQYLITSKTGKKKLGKIISIGPVHDILEVMLLTGGWNSSFSYLCRRGAVRQCGPWDEELKINQDSDYFLRMAAIGKQFVYCSYLTGLHRIHSGRRISKQSIELRIRPRQKILERTERILVSNNALTPERTKALAENYRRWGRIMAFRNREYFYWSMQKVQQICPNYLPQGRMARLTHRLLGFEKAELLLATYKKFTQKWNRNFDSRT